MGTKNYGDLGKNVGSTNLITIEVPIKQEFGYEDTEQSKVEKSEVDDSPKSNEYEVQEVVQLEGEQFSLTADSNTTDSDVKLENEADISYNNNEHLVGAFYEVKYKTEDGEYITSETAVEGETQYSFVNGESQHIVFEDGTVLGEDCVLQLVDTDMQENVNGSHTIRCADGSSIQINIVRDSKSDTNHRDSRTVKTILPCNSASIRTYPPSNKSASHSDTNLTVENTSFSYFADISDRTEEQINSENKGNSSFQSVKKSFKARPNGIACLKCKKEFSKPHQLDWHCETFCGKKPFRCYTCNKRFSKDRFNYHVSICRDKGKNKVITAFYPSSSESD